VCGALLLIQRLDDVDVRIAHAEFGMARKMRNMQIILISGKRCGMRY
jgi:hypothetical protein